MPSPLTIRVWLPLTLLGLGLGVTLATWAIEARMARDHVWRDLRVHSETIGRMAGVALEASARHGGADPAPVLAQVAADPAILGAWVLDPSGRVVPGGALGPSRTGAATLDPAIAPLHAAALRDGSPAWTGTTEPVGLLVAFPVHGDPAEAALVLHLDGRSHLEAQRVHAARHALLQGGLVLALVAMLYAFMHARVVRRLGRLDEAARRLIAGQAFGDPIGGGDEIGRVAETLRGLADALAAQRAAVARTQERLDVLLSAQGEAVLELDLEGHVTWASPGAAALLGAEPVGRALVSLAAPGREARAREAVAAVLAAPPGTRGAVDLDLGEDRVAELVIVAAARAGDGPAAVVAARDVSERRHIARRAAQNEKMEALGQLAGGIAHDFNNLLAIVAVNADLIEDPAAAEELADLRTAVARGQDLTRQLLAFGGQAVTKREPTDLSAVAREVERLLTRVLPSHVHLSVEAPARGPWVLAHPGQLDQVLVNLCVNARDAMPEGGALRLRVSAHDGLATLTVRDEGCGMTEEVRRRAIEPYFSTKEPGRGTGLGLASAYRIVVAHRGTLTLTSAPGAGTTVAIHLPLAEAPAADAPEAPAADAPHRPDAVVWVVEDDPLLRRAVARALPPHHCAARFFASAEELLDQVGDAVPDAILSDLMLSGRDGLDLIATLRARRPDLPAAIMSGYAADAELRERLQTDDVLVLPKPFEPAGLRAVVDTLLRGRAVASAPPGG